MGFTNKTQKTIHLIFFFIITLLHIHFLPVFSQTNTSRLNQGEVLRDGGDTIVSPNQVFELGFFTPVNSTTSFRYVGIWYYGFQTQTVTWVANRERPISNNLGTFSITNGSLIVSDENGVVYWSSGSVVTTMSNLTAILMDNGNFMLSTVQNVGIDTDAIWRSCDHPTDTYLPNQRVYMNTSDSDSRKFVSWLSRSDPSMGNYSMGIDPRGSPQIVVWEDRSRTRIWRSGQYNNQVFIGIPGMRSLTRYGFNLVRVNDDLSYFIFNNPNSTNLIRFMVQWNGVVEQLVWDYDRSVWVVMFSLPAVGCDEYNKCGGFGVCTIVDSNPRFVCSCMEGFDRNSSGGCVRRTRLDCNSNGSSSDGFARRTRVKLPDFGDSLDIGSSGECEDRCLMNCSCNAYAFVSGIGCLIWGGDLVDVEEFEEGGETLFIRLADIDLEKPKKTSKTLVIALSVAGAVILVIILLLVWRFRRNLKEGRNPCGKTKNQLVSVATNVQESHVETSGQQDCDVKPYEGPSLPIYSFSVIEAATDGFANKNKLGQGGFGPVHKGVLPGGQEIAVKRLSRSSGQGLVEFKNEMILIAKLQHRNLVRLLGYCIEGEERMLLYEYMPNKSLDTFLFDSTKKSELNWKTRFNIIEGIARGLLYLHRDSRLRIIHRDLKVGNILLDEEMTPKISDFGMARIFGGNQNEANTNRVVGTYGYMSPEYAMEGLFSVKSDVYSFGVLLLEIISGHRNNSFRSHDSTNLIRHAWKLWKDGKPEELIDPSIIDSCNRSEALQCIHVAMLCVQSSAVQRPTMSSVVFMLEGENTSLPQPTEVDITSLSSVEMDLIMEGREINISSNDVTITEVSGR